MSFVHATCARCGLLFGSEGSGLCERCRPLTETTGPNWLPESYTLKLTAMDVGFLVGAINRRVTEAPGEVIPAGVLRLMRKLDELSATIYGENVP
jgi:hypothetical protein